MGSLELLPMVKLALEHPGQDHFNWAGPGTWIVPKFCVLAPLKVCGFPWLEVADVDVEVVTVRVTVLVAFTVTVCAGLGTVTVLAGVTTFWTRVVVFPGFDTVVEVVTVAVFRGAVVVVAVVVVVWVCVPADATIVRVRPGFALESPIR